MGAIGLVAAAPKLIFDLAPHSFKDSFKYYEGAEDIADAFMGMEWKWVNPIIDPLDARIRQGFFTSSLEFGVIAAPSENVYAELQKRL